MGIKNLNKLLIDNNCIKYHNSLTDFIKTIKNKNDKIIIAIDTNLYYYKYLNSKLQNPFNGFLIQIKNLIKNNIIPIYVLDGKSPIEKEYLINKRKKKSVYIPYNDIKKFFDILNINYIHNNEESDKVIGILYQKKIIDYSLSDDLDILLYNCQNMISIKKGKVYEYNLEYILQKLNISFNKFIYMCILLGCDYIKPKLNIHYNELLQIIVKIDIYDLENYLLKNYELKKKKINLIFSLINKTYNIFNYDIFNYENIHINFKKKYIFNYQDFTKKLNEIDNSFIKKIHYHLILYIYKNNLNN